MININFIKIVVFIIVFNFSFEVIIDVINNFIKYLIYFGFLNSVDFSKYY